MGWGLWLSLLDGGLWGRGLSREWMGCGGGWLRGRVDDGFRWW